MNYITEINAFYDWLETNSISDSSIVLWHALMHINNKAGWITEFAVAISTLETKTGLKKDAIIRARQRLKQAGRIDFRSRTGQQSAIYTIIPFNNCVVLNDTNCDTNRNTNRAQSATQTASINKLNKTKLNNIDHDNARVCEMPVEIVDNVDNLTSLAKFIEREFSQLLNSTCIQQIKDWQSLFPDEMIKYAVEKSVLADKKNYLYVNSIINSWLRNNIQTLQEAKKADEDFLREKQRSSSRRAEGKRQAVDTNNRDLSYLVE